MTDISIKLKMQGKVTDDLNKHEQQGHFLNIPDQLYNYMWACIERTIFSKVLQLILLISHVKYPQVLYHF
ncbi:hypothetical protein LMF93_24325, partial [Salmonella enterica subsp. enterica serovar Typhimurium]|uniref:hypothetical protein n=1 Tax=Salmonella enterica TaxID=28901 RepID=UPI001E3431E3